MITLPLPYIDPHKLGQFQDILLSPYLIVPSSLHCISPHGGIALFDITDVVIKLVLDRPGKHAKKTYRDL